MAASVTAPHSPASNPRISKLKDAGATLDKSKPEGEGVGCRASPRFSPSSDKRFWSNLKSRVDPILEKNPKLDHLSSEGDAKRLGVDTAMLLRGFDSVAHSLSQLSSNIDSALQGAKELGKPPTMTEIFHMGLRKKEADESLKEDGEEGNENGRKRKLDDGGRSECENESSPGDKMLKKAKNLAVSMATKASLLGRELKSIKSDLCFMQERCVLLEEENEMLRHGYDKGIRPEEDDLVRLQLEALLAEKSRLANENATLTRENQCLRQLVEYHQATSQDLSATYEEVINGICLDFSSPPSAKAEETLNQAEQNIDSSQPAKAKVLEPSTPMDKFYDADEQQFKGFLKYSP